ncbi:hypothetical protein LEP1GSC120_0892 [Leptospira santarosai str. 200702252]|nr:hypothetical protein LEP1GSC130_1961 [Leptospira santarosai str. 200403458]EMO98157.1 hypothetical protein LEP1GSC120_0892 [Leptospira santarosai str. 200702252]
MIDSLAPDDEKIFQYTSLIKDIFIDVQDAKTPIKKEARICIALDLIQFHTLNLSKGLLFNLSCFCIIPQAQLIAL